MRAAVVAVAVVAGLAVSAVPAEASQCSGGGGAIYICEYGVTNHALPGGEKEQFLVGLDQAVWTRWTIDGQWVGWQSLGGVAKSGVEVWDDSNGGFFTVVTVTGTDGYRWSRTRADLGQGWRDWLILPEA